jgi:hypothetical protein
MFELHVVVAAVVMLNILELIMKIVPNYPTIDSMIFFLRTLYCTRASAKKRVLHTSKRRK